MKASHKERLAITAREVLLCFSDVVSASSSWHPYYRRAAWIYERWRRSDRAIVQQRLRYLKHRGWIMDAVHGKERFLEVTGKGKDRLLKLSSTGRLLIPKTWDRKWRIVIFDIPRKQGRLRDHLRSQLYLWGFLPIQESVYVFPFECKQALDALLGQWGGKHYVKYLIADIIEGEEEILNAFVDRGVLDRGALDKRKVHAPDR